MKLLKEYKIEFIFFSFLSLLFFITRFYNIMSLPIFTDEAIYTRWSQIARYDAAWRFISLTDGKQPMFVWLDMNFMRFIKDPLLAGRVVSVVSGFFSVIGLYFLGREVFKNRIVGIFSSLIYTIYPFALVYDRMALYDSLVGTFMVWALYLEILLIRKLRLDIALMLGMVIGGAILTKTSAFFSIYFLPFLIILFDFNKKERTFRLLKLFGLVLISAGLAYMFYAVLRLSPFFHIIDEKNSIFVYPVKEWLEHPFNFWWGNFLGLWDWFLGYTTWPVIFLIAFSLLVFRSFSREKLLLLIWFSGPFFALAFFGKVLYPRFILFMTLPLIPLAALSLYKLNSLFKNKLFFTFCFLLIFTPMLWANFYIITDFSRAPIPHSDKDQYINGWPAGGGVKEILSFLQKEADKGKIYVASEGTFGSLPTYGIEIYLGDNRNVDKGGIWPLPADLPKDLVDKSKEMPTFVIFNASQEKPANWPLRFISKYQKGIANSYMSLYQVESKK